MRCRYRLAVVHLGHPPHATTPQSRILVAVAPAVDCSLNQSALAPKARIQLRERPSDGVALCLVMQAISLVLVLVAARAGIHAVLRLELLRKIVDADGLDVAADRVLHLYPVSRILKSNPLHAVLVLPHDQGRGRGNGSRRCIGVHVRARWGSIVHARGADGWSLRGRLRWSQSRRWPLQRCLRHARLGASRHAWRLGVRLVRMRVVDLLALLMRHEERVCRHGLLWGLLLLLLRGRVLGIGRGLRHACGSVRRVVHGRRHLAGWLAVDGPAVLVMLGRLDRGGRVGLRGVVGYWRETRPVHGGCGHELWSF